MYRVTRWCRIFLGMLIGLWSWAYSMGDETSPVRVFMIGDSTMAIKDAAKAPERGWGEFLYIYFNDTVTISNHAVNGRSSKSFRDEGRWDPVLAELGEGDFLVIQFGHNDEKSKDPSRYSEPWTDYRDNLARYAKEAREKGARPILLTSICRRKFDDQGQRLNTHGDYPDAVRALARELDVAFVDMQKLTASMLESLGEEKSKPLFMHVAAGAYPAYPDGKTDNTHLVEKGAREVARLFALALKESGHPLSAHLRND